MTTGIIMMMMMIMTSMIRTEPRSTLLRTVVSVLKRTPPSLLRLA